MWMWASLYTVGLYDPGSGKDGTGAALPDVDWGLF